jgi:3-methylcrotonyl-CoA carboxylase alpha subunit
LHRLRFPAPEIARVDTGVRQGDAVTPFYDPLIAKIVVCGEDRPAALTRLRRALAETALLGVATNRDFLARIAAHPKFAAGAIDTAFIERHRPKLLPQRVPAPDVVLAAAALSRLVARKATAREAAARSGDPYSPWARIDGWRLNGVSHHELALRDEAQERKVIATARAGNWLLQIGEQAIVASSQHRSDGKFVLMLDGVRREFIVLDHGLEAAVFLGSESWRLVEIDPLAPAAGEDPMAGRLTAPMSSKKGRS